jgi:hypothetical protein
MLLIGFLISLFYGIRILILAFQASILWGLGCLLIPFVDLIFVVVYWEIAKIPFLKMLLAIPLVVIGCYLAPVEYL